MHVGESSSRREIALRQPQHHVFAEARKRSQTPLSSAINGSALNKKSNKPEKENDFFSQEKNTMKEDAQSLDAFLPAGFLPGGESRLAFFSEHRFCSSLGLGVGCS